MTRRAASFRRFNQRAGMTLLEVILAITALASITTLVAALWAQMRDWTAENASHHVALARERALSLFSEQWDSRVLTVSLGDTGAPAVTLDPHTLTFITTTPLFFRQAPMARVVYHVVKKGGMVVGQSAVYHLMYKESPVWSPVSAAQSPRALANAQTRTLTLFDHADDLRFERWFDESDTSNADRSSIAVGWRVVEDELDIQSQEPPKTDAKSAGAAVDSNPNQPNQPAVSSQNIHTPWRAGRLVGVIQGDSFAWQFLAGRSR